MFKKLIFGFLLTIGLIATIPNLSHAQVGQALQPNQVMGNCSAGSVGPAKPCAGGSQIMVNIVSFGADPTGVNDSSTALYNAVVYANKFTYHATSPAHTPQGACVYIPAGNYTISSAPPSFNGAGCVFGDGTSSTQINLTSTFSGVLFQWHESWIVYGTSGASIKHIRINGNLSATNEQDAIMFYDRNDNPTVEDVYINNMPGRGIASGILAPTNSSGQAYIREAHWSDIRVFNSGTSTAPAVEFATQGTGSEDGTNEVTVDSLDIYGTNGTSLVLRNNSATGTLRDVKFYGLRVEGTGSGTSTPGPLLQIGDASMTGGVGHIMINSAELIDPYNGQSALLITGGNSAGQGPSRIYFQGYIGGGAANTGYGVNIANGSKIRIVLDQILVSGTQFTVGPSCTYITLDGGGSIESSLTYSIDPTSLSGVQILGYRTGNPSLTGASNGSTTYSGTLTSDALVANASISAPIGSFTGVTVGSSGVTVSGGSVTSITFANGQAGSYTGAVGVPTLTIAAPSSGTRATATVTGMKFSQNSVAPAGGVGCQVGDLLTIVGGTTVSGTMNTFYVTAVDGNGNPTSITGGSGGANSAQTYTALPPVNTTMSGGHCTTAPTITEAFYVYSTSVTSGGSGYTTNPTVSATSSPLGTASGTGTISTSLPFAAAAGAITLNSSGTTLGVSGTSGGPVIAVGALADQSYSLQTPSTGFSITIANNTRSLILNPSGTLATGTIKMPVSPVDGQFINVTCSQTVTSLTVSPNTSQTLLGAPTTCGPSAPFGYIYNLSGTTWYRTN